MVGIVSFTKRVPPGAAGRGTLAELVARQKAAAEGLANAAAPQQINHPMQGYAQMANTAVQGFSEMRARNDETAARGELAKLISGAKPGEGMSGDALGQMSLIDPELAQQYREEAVAARVRAETLAQKEADYKREIARNDFTWNRDNADQITDEQRQAAAAAQVREAGYGHDKEVLGEGRTYAEGRDDVLHDRTLADTKAAEGRAEDIRIRQEERAAQDAINEYQAKKDIDAKAPAALDDISNMRKEYSTSQQYKRYDATLSGIQQMYAGADQGVGAGDLALIYGFIKTLDSQTGVREGETALSTDVSGIRAKVEGYLQKVKGGGFLTDDVKKEFLDTAKAMYDAEADYMERKNAEFKQHAIAARIDPDRVISPVARLPAWRAKTVKDDLEKYGGGGATGAGTSAGRSGTW